jgi:TPR repeat protein
MTENFRQFFRAAILLLAIAASMTAVAGGDFPGQEPSRRVMKAQEKADSLFEKGDYERAIFIYREELAPLGDKYAQYMIGFMHLTGKGVAQDFVSASAWYRLAAERGHEAFSGARDEVMSMLNDDQQTRSDDAYLKLRHELSDATLLSALIREDLDVLRRFTGSNPEIAGSLRDSFDARKHAYEPVAERLQQRLDYLIDLSLSEEFDSATEQHSLNMLEAEVIREIRAFAVAR